MLTKILVILGMFIYVTAILFLGMHIGGVVGNIITFWGGIGYVLIMQLPYMKTTLFGESK